MDFLAITKQVARRVDIPEPDTLSGLPSRQIQRLMDVVNEAYAIIWNSLYPVNEAAEAETTITVPAGEASIPLPFPQLTQITQDAYPPIPILTWPEYEVYTREYWSGTRPDIVGYSVFDRACVYAGRLHLWPTVHNAVELSVRGNRTFTRLINDTDTPLLPLEHRDVIPMLARALELEYQGDPQAETAKSNAMAYLQQIKRLQRKHSQVTPAIRSIHQVMRLGRTRRCR
jgi:hypothetical protein